MSTYRPDIDEKHLLILSSKGDKEAFGLLYERYMNEIYRYTYYRLGDQDEAEDITANTFLKTWEYLPEIYQTGSDVQSFRNLLYRVAKNMIVDFFRANKTVPLDINAYEEEDLVPGLSELRLQSEQLQKAILALRDDYQEIVILRFINQHSHKDVAKIMGISVGKARILQFRALKKLREVLSDEP